MPAFDFEACFASRAERMKASEIRELLKLLAQPDIISFAGGIPDPDLFPTDIIARAYAKVTTEAAAQALQYSTSEGYPPLRQWIADYMGRLGVAASPDNILITNGSQQVLDFAGRLFLSPNDTALVTAPTYLGALQAFSAYEPNYDALDLTPGTNMPAGYRERAAENGGRVKFAYAVPDFSNPTGATIPLDERMALLNLADELCIPVIEDAAYTALRYDGEPVASLMALDVERSGGIENTRTVFCGTFSKTLVPGLRVGWVCAAQRLIDKLVLIKQASDLHGPSINQMVMYEVATAVFDDQVERVRGAYQARRDAMLDALERLMPVGVTWRKPEGGMFIWLTLPEHIDGKDLLARSIREARVAFVPGGAFFADGSGANSIRLSFSLAEPDAIETGISRLGRLLRGD
jgi:DNA-binding transcriptional MocR family regulator